MLRAAPEKTHRNNPRKAASTSSCCSCFCFCSCCCCCCFSCVVFCHCIAFGQEMWRRLRRSRAQRMKTKTLNPYKRLASGCGQFVSLIFYFAGSFSVFFRCVPFACSPRSGRSRCDKASLKLTKLNCSLRGT